MLTYAEVKAEAINAEGKYVAKVISSADPANQISQVEDIIENESAKTIVILPQDNTLEATMKGKLLGVLFGAMSYTIIDKIISSLGLDALINDTIKDSILLLAVFVQIVIPAIRKKIRHSV